MIGGLVIWALCEQAPAAAPQDQLEDLTGRYAHYDVVAYQEKIGFLDMRTKIISYGLTDFVIKEGVLVSRDRFCFAEHLSNMPFTTSVNDKLTQAIVPKDVVLEVYEKNDKIAIHRPKTPTLLGTALKDMENEPLPTTYYDPRLIDADKDGYPGVTVNIKLYGHFDAKLFITRKEVFEYNMTLNEDSTISGTVIDNSQQSVVGALPFFMKSQRNPRQNPNLKLSPILLIPVSTDYSCEDLKADRSELFPTTPKP